jgi:hypothetical protein
MDYVGQRVENPLGAQAEMPVFRAPFALGGYLQLRADAAQIIEQNFHVA